MSEIETGAEPRLRKGGRTFECPCGWTLYRGTSDIGRTRSEVTYRCPNGHGWKRTAMIGFSARWEREEGVGA